MKLKVIYRLCDAVNSLHGRPDGIPGSPRPLGLDKKEVIKLCLSSLETTLKGLDHEVFIVGDRVSEEIWELAKEKLKPVYYFNSQEKLGDGKSLLESSKVAMNQNDDDLIYFVEDDYLHDPENFAQRIKDIFDFAEKNLQVPWFVHPTDYPDQYSRLLKRSYLFQTNSGYCREISSTTHTFMVQKKYYKLFVDFFRECHKDDGNDGKLSTIFQDKAICLSPLPGVATHFHIGTISNYVDWNKVIENCKQL